MRVINVSLSELETKVLMIGFQGENEITQVRIDAAEILTDYPSATPTLIVKPLFGFAYPVIVTQDGTNVVWEIDNSVLSFHGDGEIQLTFTAGTVIAKSYVGRIRIKRSLAVTGEAPDPIETWEQAATAKLAEVDAQIGELEDMVEAAEAAKDQAQDIVDDAAADIQAAGAAQVQVVQAKGTEVLNSIPADYSTLSGDVTGLKSAFNSVIYEDRSENLFDKTDIVTGKYFDINYYNVYSGLGNNGSCNISYIDIVGAGVYTFIAAKSSLGEVAAKKVALFDENKDNVSVIVGTYDESNSDLVHITISQQDIDTGAKYIGYTVENKNIDTAMVVFSVNYPEEYIAYYNNGTVFTGSVHANKVVGLSEVVDDLIEPIAVQIETNCDNIKSELGHRIGTVPFMDDLSANFELGDIAIGSRGWTYYDSTTRVRTKRSKTVKLCKGDIVKLKDYSNARYYLGWRKEDGTYGYQGWLTTDYTVLYDGEYVILLCNLTDTEQTDITALVSLLEIDAVAFKHIGDVADYADSVAESIINTNQAETFGSMIPSVNGAYPAIDTKSKTLTINGDTLIMLKFKDSNQRYYNQMSANGVPLIASYAQLSTSAIKIYYHLTNKTLTALEYSSARPDDSVLICTIRNSSTRTLASMSCPFFIDGKLYGIDNFDILHRHAVNENIKSVNHRGYNSVAPENTLPAYKLSRENGFKYVETDVSFTSDGVPVLLHDSTINRTARNADGTTISEDVDINNITYAEALAYDFGIWKSSAYAGTKIPKLEEFLVLCKNLGLHPYIELKSSAIYTEAQIQGLVDMVKQCGMKGNVTWISFNKTYLEYVKNYDQTARLGYVIGDLSTTRVADIVSLRTGSNEVFADSELASLTSAGISRAIEADIPLEIWDLYSISRLQNMNPYITGVTADIILAGYELYKVNI